MTTILMAALAAAPALAAETYPLDGRTYEVKVVDPSGKTETDTLIFQDGTFRSTMCDQYGFTAAPYVAAPGDGPGTYNFVVTATSAAEGLNTWTGSVKDDRIEGDFTWAKPGQAAVAYSFEGKAQKPATGTR
jgi:hypothetical protein